MSAKKIHIVHAARTLVYGAFTTDRKAQAYKELLEREGTPTLTTHLTLNETYNDDYLGEPKDGDEIILRR